MNQTLLRVFIVLACVWATTSVATAQIYVSRDANGTVVLSDRPLDGAARTYAVPKAIGVRTTRAVASARPRASTTSSRLTPRRNSIRPDLVRAVIAVESGFNPRARSPKGAMGLMQLMPATARDLGVTRPYDPEENIRGGVAYLRTLLDRYGENEELALAAYNAGPGAVDKYGQAVPPYRETRDYVKKDQGSHRAQRAGTRDDPAHLPRVRGHRRPRGDAVHERAPHRRHALRPPRQHSADRPVFRHIKTVCRAEPPPDRELGSDTNSRTSAACRPESLNRRSKSRIGVSPQFGWHGRGDGRPTGDRGRRGGRG